MPKVGSKHFSYTSKGKKAAESYAKKSGMPMKSMPMMKKAKKK